VLACGDSLHTTHRTLSDQCNTCEFNIAGVLRCRVWAQSTLFCGRARRTGSPLLPNGSLQHAQSVSLGHKTSKPWTKRHTVCQGQAAPPSNGRGKSSKGLLIPSKHKTAESGVSGKAKQQTRSPSKKQTGQQEVADLAALRQQKATSAAKQALGISGLQRAVALRGLDALPQPFADAAKTIMVTGCTIL